MLTHLDMFSGIGGFALACQWVGIETIGFVEIDKYCQKVLRKHWPDVPIVGDIRDVKKIKEIVANAISRSGYSGTKRMGWEKRADIDRCCERATMARPVTLITAGFPCQPFSVAGKRASERDDRYLWPETLAVIEAIKPRWVLLENVTGIINLALDTVLSGLEGAGYSYETLVIPACAVNAPHRRDRIWIVAYDSNNGFPRSRLSISKRRPKQKNIDASRQGQNVANSKRRQSREQTEPEGRQDSGRGSQEVITANTRLLRQNKSKEQTARIEQCDWWAVEPELGRVAHGIPSRVDRLKCLGNAIVPQVAYQIIKVIIEIEAENEPVKGENV